MKTYPDTITESMGQNGPVVPFKFKRGRPKLPPAELAQRQKEREKVKQALKQVRVWANPISFETKTQVGELLATGKRERGFLRMVDIALRVVLEQLCHANPNTCRAAAVEVLTHYRHFRSRKVNRTLEGVIRKRNDPPDQTKRHVAAVLDDTCAQINATVPIGLQRTLKETNGDD